jgi:ribonucleoside-diphosphate reductase beta chain
MSGITTATEIFVPRYTKLQDVLERHERSHWLPAEADMTQDVTQWKDGTISTSQKAFIKMVLRLFTQADTNVCAGYVEKVLPVYKNADARMMLLSFANREVTHMLGYKRLNDTLGYDTHEFMSEFLQYSEMREKHEFMIEQVDQRSNKGKAEYLAKQILMEGVNLFASFAMLLNFSQIGILPGMVSVNKWSIIDESLHVEGLAEIFRIFVEENPSVVNEEFKRAVYDTARKVVAMEDSFIDLCYGMWEPDKLPKQELKDYVRYVCDYRMRQLGFKRQFGIEENPLPFIDEVTGETFGNFFEATITSYSKDSLTGEWVY